MANTIFDSVGYLIWVSLLMAPLVFLAVYGLIELINWDERKGRPLASEPYVFPATTTHELPMVVPQPPKKVA